MKKLLLVAVLAVAGGLQASQPGTCAMVEKSCATPATQQVVTCPGCPPCICPKPARTICECAPATPIKKEICDEVVKCGRCHKVKRECGCREGFMHRHHHHHGRVEEVVVVEKEAAPVETTRTVRTPKRVMNKN